MYNLKKDWKAFNISLDTVKAHFETSYPNTQVDKSVVDESAALYFIGTSAGDDLVFHFNKEPVGYNGFDIDGTMIAPDVGSEAEAIENYWSGIIETSIEATDYVAFQDLQDAEKRAREDAATKGYDLLSTEQKKLIAGVEISIADRKQMLIDHPAV